MILQALIQYYEDLAARGDVSRPGWGLARVSYALQLNDEGAVVGVSSVMEPQSPAKKGAVCPRSMTVPVQAKRSVGIVPNFLCDNSSYLLGIDNKSNPERSIKCFEASRRFHRSLLSGVDAPAARAVLAFFQRWKPHHAAVHPVIRAHLTELIRGENLIFLYHGTYAQDDARLGSVWQRHFGCSGSGTEGVCLVTGSTGSVAQLHPAIRGIQGAPCSGVSLVSFHAPALCSYGHEQGQNAPVSQYAAFAYGTALNHLAADPRHCRYIGDTIVLFWAAGGEPAYQDAFGSVCFDMDPSHPDSALDDMLDRLSSGIPADFDGMQLDPSRDFYVLGLSPNTARLSVRFFLRNSFGGFLKRIQAHRKRMEIVCPKQGKISAVPLAVRLNEAVGRNSGDKSPAPAMTGELLRAVLSDTPYPATLLNAVHLRIRAEHEVTRACAAIIKAYYLKNPHPQEVPEEILTVSLNPDSSSVPYQLGRLFSVLEDIVHQNGSSEPSSSFLTAYFNSASATPARVFPDLIHRARQRLELLPPSARIDKEQKLGEMLHRLGECFPTHMNLPRQGAFLLGYYHQSQAPFSFRNRDTEVTRHE